MIADHSLPPTPPAEIRNASVDRAIGGPDKAAGNSNYQPFDPNPDPLNRRGRRHFFAQVRRTERSKFRTAIREARADRAVS